MNGELGTPRRVVGVGLVWGILWAAVVMVIGVIIGIVDPDSIDPGEGPMSVGATIIGPMGFFSGVAFAILLPIRGKIRSSHYPSVRRATGCGILGTAIVQLAYLGHGDAGLAANIPDGLLFCVLGGIIAMAWLVMARRWWQWRSLGSSS